MKSGRQRIAAFFLACFIVCFFALPSFAEEDPADLIFEHTMDATSWQPLPFLPSIPLPAFQVGPFEIAITKHLLMLILAALGVALLYACAFRKEDQLYPRGVIGNMLEALVMFVRDDIVYPVMGEKEGQAWMPFFTTLFLLILFANAMGLVPCFSVSTGNFGITLGLALIVMAVILYQGFKRLGPVGYFKNMMPEGLPLAIALPIMVIEVLSSVIKGLVLALRLFANMFAGHMAILAFITLIFIMGWLFSVVSYPLAVFTDLLEVLIVFIQAMVFVLLSCIFLDMAIHKH